MNLSFKKHTTHLYFIKRKWFIELQCILHQHSAVHIHGCDLILLMGLSQLLQLKQKIGWGFTFNDKLVNTFEICHIPELHVCQTIRKGKKKMCLCYHSYNEVLVSSVSQKQYNKNTKGNKFIFFQSAIIQGKTKNCVNFNDQLTLSKMYTREKKVFISEDTGVFFRRQW